MAIRTSQMTGLSSQSRAWSAAGLTMLASNAATTRTMAIPPMVVQRPTRSPPRCSPGWTAACRDQPSASNISAKKAAAAPAICVSVAMPLNAPIMPTTIRTSSPIWNRRRTDSAPRSVALSDQPQTARVISSGTQTGMVAALAWKMKESNAAAVHCPPNQASCGNANPLIITTVLMTRPPAMTSRCRTRGWPVMAVGVTQASTAMRTGGQTAIVPVATVLSASITSQTRMPMASASATAPRVAGPMDGRPERWRTIDAMGEICGIGES